MWLTISQIGNEINNGLLWPTGRISDNDFSGASKLLRAGASAVRRASPSTRNVIHLANGWDKEDVSWFFTGIFNGGFLKPPDIDVMAFSFYPYYGTAATLKNLNSSMEYVVSAYNKVGGMVKQSTLFSYQILILQDIMIAETSWPAACNTEATPLSEPTIPVSVEGQTIWIKDIVAILNKLSKAIGIVYWEPAWVNNSALGSSCSVRFLYLDPACL